MKITRHTRVVVALLALISLASMTRAEDAKSPKAQVLFDGKSTAGWKQCGPGSFEVKDGALVSKGGMGLFWHEKELADFVLTFEWNAASAKANSGVFVRFPDPGNDPWKAVKQGYEIQIHDAARKNRTGSVYNVAEATAFASKPAGEWNTYEIKAVGQQYTIKLNGTLVNEFTGKLAARGFIGLQNHDDGSIVSFRNVQVVELAPQAKGEAKPAEPAKPQATRQELGRTPQAAKATSR
ncbi:MAG: DUF1080 domain-containing protein [Tepidisphaeraceae bacterium]